ncbi:hypothetical protein Q3G72_023435 [Acer saccharum]|nr:hypothetical protein Q3G72_023435 [Acer saccharum]
MLMVLQGAILTCRYWGILCDQAGETICMFFFFVGTRDSSSAEVSAILKACQLCVSVKCPTEQRIIIESNSKSSVSWVNGAAGIGNVKNLDSILDIREILKREPKVSVHLVPRNGNVVANLLAKHIDHNFLITKWVIDDASSEIQDQDDIENGSVPCCRICLESDGEPDDELISPCMCKGTQQFVHRSCLDHWRSVKEGFAFSHCTTCKAQFHLQVALFEENSWRQIKFRLFVARDVFFVFLAVQTAIAAMGTFAYLMDKDGAFRNSFSDGWDRILSKHPIPFYYCLGVMAFFVLLGFFGLILHCSSLNSNDPRMAGCQNCCYGWGILDCFPASMEACFALVIVFVVIFAILGIAYGFLAATMAIQKIWQKHYHILTKRELTKEYIVEDLHGSYSPPKLDTEHEERLRALKLL